MVRLQTEAFDAGAELNAFVAGRSDAGAVVSFTGLTRAQTDGVAVDRLTLDAYPGYTEQVMAALERETHARFDLIDVMVIHRWGALEVGEPIVLVAVAAVHRREAFEACDYLMDQLKIRAPFWKRESGPGGDRWIEARAADHKDAARWGRPETPLDA